MLSANATTLVGLRNFQIMEGAFLTELTLALQQLKKYQKFATTTSITWASHPAIIDDFPITIGPETLNVINLLKTLATLSETIPVDQNYVLFELLNQTLLEALLLASKLTNLNINNREDKLMALTATIQHVIELAKNPLTTEHLGAVKDAANRMKQTVDILPYFNRYENRTQALLASALCTPIGAALYVGGTLAVIAATPPLALTLSLGVGSIVVGTFMLGSGLALGCPTRDENQLAISKHACDLQKTIANVVDKGLLMSTNLSHDKNATLAPLSEDEVNAITTKINAVHTPYKNNYLRVINTLNNDATNFLIINTLCKPESYERINAYGNYDLVQKLLLDLEDLNKCELGEVGNAAIQATIDNSLQVALEIGTQKCDMLFETSRKQKLEALRNTINAMKDFVLNNNDITQDKLLNSAETLRSKLEGPYIGRKENRLLTGILSGILAVVALASLVTLLAFAPAIALALTSAATIAIIVAGTINLAIAISIGIGGIIESIHPSKPIVQDSSRKISQQVSLLSQSFFHKNRQPQVELPHNLTFAHQTFGGPQ